MFKKIGLLCILLVVSTSIYANELGPRCQKKTTVIHTPRGNLELYNCPATQVTAQKSFNWQSQWMLSGKSILVGNGDLSPESRNTDGSLIALSDSTDDSLACPSRMFLIDLTRDKPHVYAFGVKNACAEYHWASWGKKRSVIAIKENIRFTYSNGKLIPPPADFGDGTPVNIRPPADPRSWPFVEEIPIK